VVRGERAAGRGGVRRFSIGAISKNSASARTMRRDQKGGTGRVRAVGAHQHRVSGTYDFPGTAGFSEILRDGHKIRFDKNEPPQQMDPSSNIRGRALIQAVEGPRQTSAARFEMKKTEGKSCVPAPPPLEKARTFLSLIVFSNSRFNSLGRKASTISVAQAPAQLAHRGAGSQARLRAVDRHAHRGGGGGGESTPSRSRNDRGEGLAARASLTTDQQVGAKGNLFVKVEARNRRPGVRNQPDHQYEGALTNWLEDAKPTSCRGASTQPFFVVPRRPGAGGVDLLFFFSY